MCLQGTHPSSRVGIFPWLPPSLSPARLHNLRKLTVLGIRSTCWQALAHESTVFLALWSASPQLTCFVVRVVGFLMATEQGKSCVCSETGETDCASVMMPALLKWL